MEKAIAELKELLLKNKDITRYGDGYEKAMIQAIDVCEKNNINTSEQQLQQADVSWRSELLLDFVSTMKGIKPNWNCDQMIERINDYYK